MPKMTREGGTPSSASIEVKRDSEESGKVTGTGWDKVAAKKKLADERSTSGFSTIMLRDGESARIQFLDDDPYCFNGHQSKALFGNWYVKVCQLERKKYCMMCEKGLKTIWFAAFRVLDFRGDWDKEKECFKGGEPVERVLQIKNPTAIQLKGMKERYGKRLTELVLDYTRTGAGATDTKYNFERAVDEKTEIMVKPKVWKTKMQPLREIMLPPSDNALVASGFTETTVSSSDDEERLPF